MSGIQLDQKNVEKLIALMDRRDKLNSDIRIMLAGNLVACAQADPESRGSEVKSAMKLDITISGIEWKRSNKQGGGAAGPNDGWAWAFALTKDGGIRRESAQLLAALEQYGKVLVDGFEITLSGRNKRLLNRKKLNYGGR